LRLLFVQMVLMYWCNGLYKWTGVDWPNGDSLYYVLGDLTLTRWSYAQFPIPYPVTRIMSWTVFIWEVTFPLWVCLPWGWLADRIERMRWLPQVIRRVPLFGHSFGVLFDLCRHWSSGLLRRLPLIALTFGVLFHLGIGASMELGLFVPYALCL